MRSFMLPIHHEKHLLSRSIFVGGSAGIAIFRSSALSDYQYDYNMRK